MAEAPGESVEVTFRSAKRRKIFRRKHDSEDDESAPAREHSAPNLRGDSEVRPEDPEPVASQDEESSVADILRRRKLSRFRRIGIEFSNTNGASHSGSVERAGLLNDVASAEGKEPVKDLVVNRFAPQTGQVKDELEKHMIAYVDSKIARLREGALAAEQSDALRNKTQSSLEAAPGTAPLNRQPAGLGKLQEIDLGPDAMLQNIARTEAATRRLKDGQVVESDGANAPQKVRLGRDGKPMRRRNRRNSDDVKRDRLVEEVLKESRLDMYEGPEEGQDVNDEPDQAADDRIAEEFCRDFMEAIASRNLKRSNPAPPSGGKAGKGEEKPKGPKLGGSRSARAAMRAREEAAKKK